MLGDRIGIAAGLIDDQHARRGAGLDIDGVKARAVGRDDQEIWRAPQQVVIDVKMASEFVARGADLIGMRRGKNGRGNFIGTFILEPVKPHVGPAFEDFNIDVVGEILDVEDALVVDRHSLTTFSWDNHGALRDWSREYCAASPDPASISGTAQAGVPHRAFRLRRADAASRRPTPAVPDWRRPAPHGTGARRDNRARRG